MPNRRHPRDVLDRDRPAPGERLLETALQPQLVPRHHDVRQQHQRPLDRRHLLQTASAPRTGRAAEDRPLQRVHGFVLREVAVKSTSHRKRLRSSYPSMHREEVAVRPVGKDLEHGHAEVASDLLRFRPIRLRRLEIEAVVCMVMDQLMPGVGNDLLDRPATAGRSRHRVCPSRSSRSPSAGDHRQVSVEQRASGGSRERRSSSLKDAIPPEGCDKAAPSARRETELPSGRARWDARVRMCGERSRQCSACV